MTRFAAASGIVLCAAMTITNAHAADGRILFVGSVMAPTCAPRVIGDHDPALTDELHAQCPPEASNAHYTLHLEPASTSRVRLVEYYDSYVSKARPGQSIQVATQTYD